jgi:Multiubiquitin
MATETEAPNAKKPPKSFKITIDGKPYQVAEKELTAAQILGLAGKTPAEYYLVEIRGKKERISYKDKPNELVKLHAGSKFITVSTGETPVS